MAYIRGGGEKVLPPPCNRPSNPNGIFLLKQLPKSMVYKRGLLGLLTPRLPRILEVITPPP